MTSKGQVKRWAVLKVVASSSRPQVQHEIRWGGDGVVYCTCEAWKYSRSSVKNCKHLKAFEIEQEMPLLV